jgi:hypothetical protein
VFGRWRFLQEKTVIKFFYFFSSISSFGGLICRKPS